MPETDRRIQTARILRWDPLDLSDGIQAPRVFPAAAPIRALTIGEWMFDTAPLLYTVVKGTLLRVNV